MAESNAPARSSRERTLQRHRRERVSACVVQLSLSMPHTMAYGRNSHRAQMSFGQRSPRGEPLLISIGRKGGVSFGTKRAGGQSRVEVLTGSSYSPLRGVLTVKAVEREHCLGGPSRTRHGERA